jgi:acetyl-CoA carboxylase carboxyl transferase subunit beta
VETKCAVDAVGAIVFREDGAVLLVRRKNPPLAGSWTLPGGRVEKKESPEDAIVREVREETALEVVVVKLVETFVLEREGFSYRIMDFLCRVISGDVRAADDASEAHWVLPAQFDAFALTPDVLRVIAAARETK